MPAQRSVRNVNVHMYSMYNACETFGAMLGRMFSHALLLHAARCNSVPAFTFYAAHVNAYYFIYLCIRWVCCVCAASLCECNAPSCIYHHHQTHTFSNSHNTTNQESDSICRREGGSLVGGTYTNTQTNILAHLTSHHASESVRAESEKRCRHRWYFGFSVVVGCAAYTQHAQHPQTHTHTHSEHIQFRVVWFSFHYLRQLARVKRTSALMTTTTTSRNSKWMLRA